MSLHWPLATHKTQSRMAVIDTANESETSGSSRGSSSKCRGPISTEVGLGLSRIRTNENALDRYI